DGAVPNKLPSDDATDKKNRGAESLTQKEKLTLKLDQYERPENRSQFDYIRRLAKRIKLEASDKASDMNTLEEKQGSALWTILRPVLFTPRKPAISAIGVLGTDPYDELLILQALRQEFPDTIFFSTDLDARLWHGS